MFLVIMILYASAILFFYESDFDSSVFVMLLVLLILCVRIV